MPECTECKAPLTDDCPCECGTTKNCHVCRALYSVIYRSSYFTNLHNEEDRDNTARRNRMGL